MLRRSSNFILTSIFLDTAAIVLAANLAHTLRRVLPLGQELVVQEPTAQFMLSAVGIFLVVFLAQQVYDPDKTFRVVDEMQSILVGGAFACLALAGWLYFTERGISRLQVVYFYLASLGLIIAWRVGARLLLRIVRNGNGHSRRVVLVGSGDPVQRAAERLQQLDWAGVEVLGCITDEPNGNKPGNGLKVFGDFASASRIIRREHVDDVIIAAPKESYARVDALVDELHQLPCNLWVSPDYLSLLLYGSRVENLGGVPMISLKVPTLTGYQRLLKRAFDLVLGSAISFLLLPLMGIVAIAIKLDSPGSVIFRQRRVGENGRLFEMYKFRSMTQHAQRRTKEILSRDAEGNLLYKREDDPRVTRVGRWMRKTSLDELPQLFNVLRGDMSLVGPRPEMPWLVDQYKPWQRKRFAVPQGMTGWWQVNGRSDKPMHLNTEDDLFYIRHYSILLDLRILLKTALVVVRAQGAY
jgi:exopolysaccharide biosynthesis polyprenyl glycosylphosphotransferase